MTNLDHAQDITAPHKPKTYIEQYYDAIKFGSIIVGQELYNVLSKLVADMKDPKYYYDTKEAHKRIRFIEKFCRHTKSPFHNKPFILELWEKAFVEVIYSFKKSHTGLRRFKRVILLISRKNGKSTLAAALAFTELMLGHGGSDIVCSSNDDAQAGIIFDEIANMRELFDAKNKRTHKNRKIITNKKNKSKVFKLTEKTQKKEGYNIEFGILDESHEMKDNSIAKPIQQSQSTKDEPLFINITTEGYMYARLKVQKRVTPIPSLVPGSSLASCVSEIGVAERTPTSLVFANSTEYIGIITAGATYSASGKLVVFRFDIVQVDAEL